MEMCAINVILLDRHLKTHKSRKNVEHMQPVQFYTGLATSSQETYENTQWRKVKQMQPMRLCILSGKQFKEAFENTPERIQVNQIIKKNQIKRLCT